MDLRSREVLHYLNLDGRDFFAEWLEELKDIKGRAAILKRIDRVEEGLFGDHRFVGAGVWELRINYGPGYRIYYGEAANSVVLLIMGGDKSSQRKDIQRAHDLWADFRRRQ